MKVVLCVVALGMAVSSAEKLTERFAWQELEFAWPSGDVRDAAIREGSYIRSNNLPLALDVWKDKIFLTVPRC